MSYDQIDLFMAAIRRLESGSFAGNYAARGPTITGAGMYQGDHAFGAYQIMTRNWAGWAAQAGLAGADIRSRAAQDRVARFKFTQYWNELQDWGLVAIAWFAGLGRAREAQKTGVATLSGVADQNGTSVPSYVSLIQRYMADPTAVAQYGGGTPATPLPDGSSVSVPSGTISIDFGFGASDGLKFTDEGMSPQQILHAMFATTADRVAGGQRATLADARKIPRVDPATITDIGGADDDT
jgi:hypothetical protein